MSSIRFTRIPLILLIAFFINGCKSDAEKKIQTDPAFGEYVFAYTSGVVSSTDPIIVQLSEPYTGTLRADDALPDNLFSFEPEISGQTIWLDESTLKFIPNEYLKSNTLFRGKLNLSLLMDVPKEMKEIGRASCR